jgi:hypothetical protein
MKKKPIGHDSRIKAIRTLNAQCQDPGGFRDANVETTKVQERKGRNKMKT